jgi:hypothetical protein
LSAPPARPAAGYFGSVSSPLLTLTAGGATLTCSQNATHTSEDVRDVA